MISVYSAMEEPFQKLVNQGMIQGRSNFVYRIKDTNTLLFLLNLKDNYDTTPTPCGCKHRIQ